MVGMQMYAYRDIVAPEPLTGSSPRSWGVSKEDDDMKKYIESSPRSWGCFRNPPGYGHTGRVFPTLVGVFPLCFCRHSKTRRLPHARGGVSIRADLVGLA